MMFFLSLISLPSLVGSVHLWAQGQPETQPGQLDWNPDWLNPLDPSLAEQKIITIAVVQDGSSPHYTQLLKEIEKEFRKVMGLMGEEKEITFITEGYNAGWNPGAIPSLLGKALTDSEVDIVLTLGILSAQGAASPVLFLTKPVVSTLVDRSELLALPINSEGKSSKANYTFVVLNLPVSRDFEVFHNLMGFTDISILGDGVVAKNLKGLNKVKSDLEKKLGIKINIILGGSNADTYLKQLSHHTSGVMVSNLPRLSETERQKLIDGIVQLGIPSFSLLGYSDVKKGVMAGLIPDTFGRTARRGALDLQQVVLGFAADELSVLMPIESRLLINGKTARLVGYSPDFMTLQTADFILDDPFKEGEQLNLDEAIRLAGEANIDVAISQANTEAQKQQSLIQRSFLLPQANSSISYTQIDRDRAAASMGSTPQRQTLGNLNFNQVIFDDKLLSNFRRSQRDAKSAKYDQATVRYDSMLAGGQAYLELLANIALLRIESQNLSLTQDNLDMARLRFDVGLSGQDEVYRWEAQEAQQRSDVIRRASNVDNAMVTLNRVLNQPQDKVWNAQDFNQEEALNYFFKDQFVKLVNTLKKNRLMEQFLVGFGLKHSPELSSVVQQVEGQSISLNQSKRSFYVPSLGANFDYFREFQSNRPGALGPFPANKDNWALTGQVSLPLFQGGLRVHEMNQNKAQLMRLNGERIRTIQAIEQNIRFQLNDLAASRPNLFLTREAAKKAKLNLDIVKDKYSEGTVGILDLLDAQNEYIQREQEAALAVYQYLGDQLEVQRAVSWFAADHDQTEVEQVFRDAEDYIRYGKKPRPWENPSREFEVEQNVPLPEEGSSPP